MQPSWNPVIAVILALSLAGCATTSAPEHQSQTAPNANLGAYKTFGWKSAAGDGVSDEPMRMVDTHIRAAIRAELVRRGYTEAESNPEFVVFYDTEAQDKVKSNPFRIGIGIGSYGSSGGGSVNVGSPSVQNVQEGKLVVHAVDTAKNAEVWYGTVAGNLKGKTLDAETVARAVAIAMQDFPPRS